TFDGFELAARAVIGQQISVRAARTTLGRIAEAFGDALPHDGDRVPMRLFPTAKRIATLPRDALARPGLTRARTRTLIELAAAIASGKIRLEPGGDVDATLAALTALPGIGTWTANYIAMRALRWPDAFLASDLVVLKTLGETKPARALRESEAWRPWRSYAVIHLWRSAA